MTTFTRIAFIVCVLAILSLPASALTESDFRVCISALGPQYGYGNTCQLNAGTYAVSQVNKSLPGGPFEIGRSNITVTGTWITSRSDTKIVRGTLAGTPLMFFAPYIQSVLITEFYFDGNRRSLGKASPRVDLDLQWAGNNLSNITVQAEFYDSVDFSLTVGYYNTLIQYSAFRNAAISGIWAGPNVSGYTIQSNQLENCGAGAIGVSANSPGTIANNSFYANHREWPYNTCNGPCPGGQLFLDQGSTSVTVSDNWIDGAMVQSGNLWTAGLEVYGSGHNLLRNKVFGHSGPGIYLTGAQNVTISGGPSGWKVDNNNYRTISPTFSGIEISNSTSIPQLSQNIQITNYGATNRHLYPVTISTNGVGNISGISITNNCFAGNTNSTIRTLGAVSMTESGNAYSGCQ